MDTGAATNIDEGLELAKDMVKRMYPEQFNSARRTSMAESAGESSVTRMAKRSWSDVKPEIREDYEQMLRTTPGLTKEGLLKRFPAEYFRR